MDLIVFAVGALLAIAGALGVVTLRHPVHAALMLVVSLFGVAVLFVARDADFLAAVQVIVYTGAVVVLFLFVIMLLGVDREDLREAEVIPGQRIVAAVLGLAVLGGFAVTLALGRDFEDSLPPTTKQQLDAIVARPAPAGLDTYLGCLQTNGVVLDGNGGLAGLDGGDPTLADARLACTANENPEVSALVSEVAPLSKAVSDFEDRNVEALGETIFTKFVVPFEITSLLLLIAVLGAVYLSRRPGPMPVGEES